MEAVNKANFSSNNDFFKEILETVTDGVWVTDKHDSIIFFNSGMEKIAGIKREDCIGINVLTGFPEETIHEFKEHYLKVKSSLEPVFYEAHVKTPSGKKTVQQGWLTPIIRNGEYQGIICTIHDITEKKKTENFLKETLDVTTDGIWTWNFQSDTLFFSDRYYLMLGYEPQEFDATYENWVDLIHPNDKEKAIATAEEYLTHKPDVYENSFRLRTKQGDYRWVRSKARVVERDDTGDAIRMIGSHEDITEKKNAEEKLHYFYERFHRLAENIPGVIYQYEQHPKNNTEEFTYISPSVKEMFGLAPSAIEKDSNLMWKAIHPDDLQDFSQSIEESFKEMKLWIQEFRIKSSDGNIKWLKGISKPEKQPDGSIIWDGLLTDITKRKQIEKSIQDNEEKFILLFENSISGVVICKLIKDEKGNPIDYIHLHANPACEKQLEQKPEHLINKKATELIGDEAGLLYAQKNGKAIITGKPQTWVHFTPEPYNRYLRMDSYFIKDDLFAIVFENITEKMQMQEKLMESQERYRSLFEDSHDWVFIHDFKGNFIDANSAALDGMGYNKHEIQNLSFQKIIEKRDLFKAFNETRKLIKNGQQKDDVLRYRVKRKDGSLAILETVSSLLYKDGVPYAVQGIARDITDKITSEEKIAASEEKYRNIVNLAPDGIITMNLKGYITSINPAFSSLTGYSEEEIVGKHFTKLPTMSNIDMSQYLPLIKTVFLGEKAKTIDFKWRNKQGDLRSGQAKISMMKLKGKKNNIQAILRDTTEEKRAEEKLKQAHQKLQQLNKQLEEKVDERTEEINRLLDQKDEFINQLGHDLKNPLGPLVNLLPILEQNEQDPKNKEILNVINRNVSYMKNLVTKTIQLAQLRSPSCELHMEQVKLADEINEIIETNRLMFEENQIQIEKNLNPNIQVFVDKLRIHEVFNNIFNNAVKYSNKNGGTIFINQKENDDFIEITIKDTGAGMTSNQLEKVFDEFFKADQSRHEFDSSGLGLPITKRIIELHGGRIWAESEGIGKGSVFYFTIPKTKI